jgi:hypothetical protein
VETYQRIEDEQARLQFGDSLGEVAAVGIQIEPDGLGRTPNRRGTKVRFKPDAQIFGDKAMKFRQQMNATLLLPFLLPS